MANVKLIFYGTEHSEETELTTYVNAQNELFISIENDDLFGCITLDKSTAIKFAKTLRTEINKMDD